jgi:hypothetical protein
VNCFPLALPAPDLILALPHAPARSPHQLIVRKETGLFVLREFANGKCASVMKAMNAQMIQDYLGATWPVGTVAQWIIVPPFQPARIHETLNGAAI